jgi:hypothetical protein
MANKLVLKRSSVAAKVPLATDLVAGELAVNLADAKLYTKDGSGNVILVGSGAAGAVSSVAGKTGAVTLVKGDVGLGNVDNTSDASKPVSTAQQTALDLKSNLASPTFTGVPAAPTAAVGTNTTQLATTAYVNAEIANDAAPIAHVGSGGTAHAAASTSVAGFMSAADKTKLDGIAAGAQVQAVSSVAGRTGAVTLAVADVSGAAPLASPTLTGVPAAPTAAVATNTTQIATTAFVNAEIANDATPISHVGTGGTQHAAATTAVAGFMSAADKTKLDGVASGATANTGTVTGVTATAPVVSSGGTAPVISITAATTSAAGSMSAADKTKLDGIAAGATANTGTVTGVTGTAPIVSSGGTAPAISISAATTVAAGSMSAADKAKLDGIAAGATANTGTVTGVTGTAPIVSSGGAAPAISISAATTLAAGSMSAADKSKLDGIQAGAQVNAVTSVNGQTGAVTVTGAVAGGAMYENTQAISANYTITSGRNALSAGPITINSGITVTVPSGSTWVVV